MTSAYTKLFRQFVIYFPTIIAAYFAIMIHPNEFVGLEPLHIFIIGLTTTVAIFLFQDFFVEVEQ